MKRILQITGSLAIGGLETVALNIVRYCGDEYKFDFLVFGDDVSEGEIEARRLGCKVIHLEKPNKNYIRYYCNLKRIICENGPYDICTQN